MQPPHSSAVKLISRGSSSAVIYKDGSEKTIDNPADFPIREDCSRSLRSWNR